jgi:hypothetical protein
MAKQPPKRGRPPKRAGLGKTLLMQVRLSPAEKEVFTEAADLDGQQLSVWVRDALRRAAAGRLREAGRPDPFVG